MKVVRTAGSVMLAQILAVIGCTKEPLPPAGHECPESLGDSADWQSPGMMNGVAAVCLPKVNGVCPRYSDTCILSRYSCGLVKGGQKVDGKLRSKEDACCWKVEGECAVGRPFVVDGEVRLASLVTGAGWSGP